MMWGWYGGMGWWMVFGGIIFILFWGLIIYLIVWGIRRFSGSRGTGGPDQRSPLDIAKERYARGEISKEQFDQIKRDLSG
jgi:putative membrane protein